MDSDEYYESHEEELLEEYEEEEDVGVMVAPEDGLNMVMIVFTTVFLLLGIGIMFWELHSLYEGWGSSAPKRKTVKSAR